MNTKDSPTHSTLRAAILGAAVGDALGGPHEFQPVDSVPQGPRGRWISELDPYAIDVGLHGVWREGAPPGTGTDDTRYHALFLGLCAELRRPPVAAELAARLLDAHREPHRFYPPAVAGLACDHYAWMEPACTALLGQPSAIMPALTREERLARGTGLNFAVFLGMLIHPTIGLFFPGEPERAYRAAWELGFLDLAHAREANGLFAAALALCPGDPREVLRQALAINPFQLGMEFEPPYYVHRLAPLVERAPVGSPDEEVARWLAAELRHTHVFDPLRALAVAFVSAIQCEGDPNRALRVAVNFHDEHRFHDIDCHGSITGALVGALFGAQALDARDVALVLHANRDVHGIDLEEVAARAALALP